MLFPYQYINHSIEKMQKLIDYIFYEVWCKAPSFKRYSLARYNNNRELKDVIKAFHYSNTEPGDFFNSKIEEIYYIFKTLNPHEIHQLENWYQSNNDIENLCINFPGVIPATYAEISQLNINLAKALKAFFVRLYSQDLLSLKALADKIGVIDDHYKEFVKINSKGKCPFCGLLPIDSEYVHTREAYDHYLPKSKYPFSTINFKNLVPICNKCNSGNKGTKDPLHDTNGNRRKSFYAYNTIPYKLEINIQINTPDIPKLTPQDISITFGPANLSDEIRTWNELFGIEERYKAKCCSEDAKYWLTQITDECQNYGLAPNVIFQGKLREAEKSPYSETNFLRKPFLEACNAQNVFG